MRFRLVVLGISPNLVCWFVWFIILAGDHDQIVRVITSKTNSSTDAAARSARMAFMTETSEGSSKDGRPEWHHSYLAPMGAYRTIDEHSRLAI
ncbi:hypothetical protein PAXRUDRAFT_821801 [Paxillus rubicundulus Ve08.2h10]|uniref:Uncharacterized protein n=1 Tax=Paxillus rubicundulus Ve08.2h10 TaxID=930991 RepID=A0A0D0E636_9AGAM|nr:hypothetical protein PAXRUDRAFT_821801 [Paxillus rubicundulus Ve08.2h10]